jgi:tetratricopeptide (TPR) repeat protein
MNHFTLSPTYWQGLLLYKQQKWAAAGKKFAEVLAKQPHNAAANFKLGMCHLKQKQWIRASRFINQAIELSPQKQGWRVQQEQANKERIKSELAKLKESKKTASQKEAQIREWIGQDYNNPQLHNELAHTLRKQGKWWQEVEALTFATRLEGRYPTWFYRLGEALEAMNRFQQAAKAYGQAIALKNGKAEAEWHYRQGHCFEREGHDGPANPGAAKKAYAQAIAQDTQLKAKRFGIGAFHEARGLWAKAQQAYAQQHIQAPWDAELCYRLGMAHDRCYEWADAEKAYRLALALDIQQIYWHYRLGFVLERQHKYQDAAIAYEYAAKNRDTHTPYWFYRWGYVLEQAGQYEQACQAYLKTQTQQTLDPIELDSILVQYKEQLTNQDLIATTLEKFLETDAANPQTWYKLGNAYERMKNWSKAIAAYKKSVDINKAFNYFYNYRLGFALNQVGEYIVACQYLKGMDFFEGSLNHPYKLFGVQVTSASLEMRRRKSSILKYLVKYKEWKKAATLVEVKFKYEINSILTVSDISCFIKILTQADEMARANEFIDQLPKSKILEPLVSAEIHKLRCKQLRTRWWMNYGYSNAELYGPQITHQEWIAYIEELEGYRKTQKSGAARLFTMVDQELNILMLAVDTAWAKGNIQSATMLMEHVSKLLESDTISKQTFVAKIIQYCIESQTSLPEKISPEVLRYIANIDIKVIDEHEWVLVEKILAWNGLLRASYYARKNAVMQFISIAKSHDVTLQVSRKEYYVNKAILGAIEFEYYGDAQEIIELNDRDLNHSTKFNKIKAYFSLIKGDGSSFIDIYRMDFKEAENNFLETLENKSIAIVAPAQTDYSNGREIDGKDFVLRLNSLGVTNSLNKEKYGNRTDIVSFNDEKLRALIFGENNEFPDDKIKYVIHKIPPKYEWNWLHGKLNIIRSARLTEYNFFGNTNHVPDLIFYLILFAPKKIKIYSVNFFLNKNPYDESYRSDSSLTQLIWGDNLITGFSFAKKMYANGVIDVDSTCRPVIELSVEEYMTAMEKMHLPTGSLLRQNETILVNS